MSTGCGKRKLRGLYQDLLFPTTRATVARESRSPMADTRNRATDALLLQGTNGPQSVYPFWGTFKSIRETTREVSRENRGVLRWLFVLLLAAAAAAVAFSVMGSPLPPWWQVAALIAVGGIAERLSIRVTTEVEMSVSFLPFVFTAVAFGPYAAFLVALGASFSDLRRPFLRWAVYTPARALTGAATGLAAAAVATPGTGSFGRLMLATLAAGLVNFAVDTLFNIATLLVRRTGRARALVELVFPVLLLSLPLYTPVVALMAYGYVRYSFWVAATFFIPAVALQRLLQLYQEQRDATRALGETNARLERANLSFAAALVATLDARDRYTAGHSAAVAVYARDIAARMGLSKREQDLVHLCGLVHDIGKIGLPAGLLEKPGPLTLEERRLMEEHSTIGERILSNVEGYAEIARIVRHHHERIDGNGYPDQLSGSEIPVLSRIVSVADAYNAMTSHRPYRDAMPSQVARLRLAQAVESQFDTAVVAAFEAILASAPEEYRGGASITSWDEESKISPIAAPALAL
jgi:putative nucleotidyltransferase with HDIG domain